MLDEVADSAMLLAARPATPMVSAPYRLILRFLQGGIGVRPGPHFGLGPFLGSGFKIQNQLATAAMSLRFTSMFPTTSFGGETVMSICPTVPALATELLTSLPAASAAVTLSL